jgi:alkaline phosphatase D
MRTSPGHLPYLAALFIATSACADSSRPYPSSVANAGITARAQTTPRTPNGTGGINDPETLDKDYVVLISFDGFRHDYRERYDTPNFDRVAERGTTAEALIPVYPSLTFPSHYSIATGLYPERHGLVGNQFYDPARDERYSYRESDKVQDGSWYAGEPIWVTAESQGMVSAAMLFVGTEADIGGIRPTYWTPYARRGPPRERVDQVLRWFELPARMRPHLVTLYFSAVDSAGHRNGPATAAVAAAVREVDQALGQLLDGLEHLPYGDRISIVLVSDHGMASVDPARITNLHDIADLRDTRVVVNGPGVNLFVNGSRERALALRDDINDELINGRAYLRDEVPTALHYRAHPRIGDVVIVAEPGAMISLRRASASPAGMHGWPPLHPDMGGIFLAAGPDIARNSRVGPIEAIHVYPFLAELLQLSPNANIDGNLSILAPLLTRPVRLP